MEANFGIIILVVKQPLNLGANMQMPLAATFLHAY
jgi:hypothetical protein